MKTSLLTIISVVAVAAAAFPSFDAEKLDANSAGSLAATAETFPSFNQNAPATASFSLSNAESDATAAAFCLGCSFCESNVASFSIALANATTLHRKNAVFFIKLLMESDSAKPDSVFSLDAFGEPLPSF